MIVKVSITVADPTSALPHIGISAQNNYIHKKLLQTLWIPSSIAPFIRSEYHYMTSLRKLTFSECKLFTYVKPLLYDSVKATCMDSIYE